MLQRPLKRLTDILAFAGGAAVVLMMVHVCADVIAKYAFNMPIRGTLEIVSNYYMVAVVFLPLALVERRNAHISVEILSQHLPLRMQTTLIGLVCLACIVFYGMFFWQSLEDAIAKYEIGEYLRGQIRIVNWPSRFMLPLGIGAIILVLAWKSVCAFRGDERVIGQVMDADEPGVEQ